jgi:sulfatase maturation enzyme AslB (radical SAM superfamily)
MSERDLRRPVHSPDTASRVFSGEAVVITPAENTMRMFNTVGSRIWELADGQRTMDDMFEALLDEYAVAPGHSPGMPSALHRGTQREGADSVREVRSASRIEVDTFIPLFDRQATTGPFEREFAGCAPVDQSADYYDTLLARLRSEHVPYSVLWELTHKCNLKCVMCYNDPLSQPELSTDECLTILAQLVEAGTLRLTLTGGEILTRPDFFEIALEARKLGFALDLKTNGTLITPEAARRIASLAPLQVDISLLGACPETFDLIAGVSRTLERVLRGVRLLQYHGVRVKLNTLLMDLNLSERYAMVDLANRLGVLRTGSENFPKRHR